MRLLKPNELILPTSRWGFRITLVVLCAVIMAAGYLLFGDEALVESVTAKVFGETIRRPATAWLDTDKTARVQRMGSADWENAPKNTELREGDRVFIPDGARGSVIFYGPAGTKGRERSQPLASLRVYRILAQDVVAVGVLSGEGTRAIKALGAEEYTYDEIEKAIRELSAAWREFQSRAGARGKLKPVTGSTLKLDRIDDFAVELSVTPPQVKAGEGATLAWSPVPIPGVSYILQVASDESFKGAMKRRLAENQSPVNFKREGKYFVRVIASKGREAIVSGVVAVDVASPGNPAPAAEAPTEPAKAPAPEAAPEKTVVAKPEPSPKSESIAKAEPGARATAKPKPPKRIAAPAASRRGTEPPTAPESLGSDLNGFTAEVATDPAFRDIVASALTTEARCPKSGLKAGTYYCRLTPIQGDQTPRSSKFVVKGE